LRARFCEPSNTSRPARYTEAEAAYRDVLAECPDDPSAMYLYGLLQLQRGQSERAAESLTRAATLRPKHVDTRLSLGRALLSAGRPAPALAEADAVLAHDPTHAQALFLRGTALAALDRPEAAASVLRAAIAEGPGNAAAHLHFGNALADLDQLEAAEAACQQAIARDAVFVEAWVSLGFILTSRGKLADAITACDRALALQPDCAQAHWNLAVAALLAGDYPPRLR
jgi:tetratricopeptide (TPR) repeat protein